MRRTTLPRDHSQLRTSSGKETLRRCNVKWNVDDVVVIDVECSTFPEVIVVDEPEHWKKKLHGSDASRGDQRVPFEGVISIDDEEDDDDVGPGIGAEGRNGFDGASTSKVPARNHYGLDSESESGSFESDSDCSDCELIDSSFDKFHELWNKAYHNRRNGAHKTRSGQVDQPFASGHYSESNPDQIASTSSLGTPSEESNESTDPRNGADRARSGPDDRTESSMTSMPEVNNEKGSFIDGDVVPSFHKDIINDREKLKETDEYKRAIEEEWASRQQQLQIQAEEAQRLKKRKKAETLRLLDMEKRQKQRVEEVRETQKKDEEHMNLKDQLRVEIRKELSSLENTCKTMPSLFRGLGISVGGGAQPSSNEVHAAYKRALLKFHPDRASRMDVRQQVEAEEKFKLISRMKEKLLS